MKPGRKRWIITAAIALALIGAGVLAFIYLPEPLQRWQANRLLNAFRANPCQQTADPLIALLNESRVKQDQGDEILTAMLESTVIQRPTVERNLISLDVIPKHSLVFGSFGLSVPYDFVMQLNEKDETLCFAGGNHSDSRIGNNSGKFEVLVLPQEFPEHPGDYPAKVVYSIGFDSWPDWTTHGNGKPPLPPSTIQRFLKMIGLGPQKPRPKIAYTGRFSIPLTIHIAATSPASSSATTTSSQP